MANKNPDTSGMKPGGSPGAYKFTKEDLEKSAAVRREKAKKRKTFKEAFETLLDSRVKTEDGKELNGLEALALTTMQMGLDGNLDAIKTIRDSVGEKPVERVMVAEVDPDIINEVEAAVLGDINGNTDDETSGD